MSAGSAMVVARNLPVVTTPRTTISKSGSTIWICPALIVLTASSLTSTPITSIPRDAMTAAVGKPI